MSHIIWIHVTVCKPARASCAEGDVLFVSVSALLASPQLLPKHTVVTQRRQA